MAKEGVSSRTAGSKAAWLPGQHDFPTGGSCFSRKRDGLH